MFIAHAVSGSDPKARSSVALLDFLFFFVQSLLFYVMALIMREAIWFYSCYIAVLTLDCVWLALVRLESRERWSDVQVWFWTNATTATVAFLALSTPLLPEDLRRWVFLSAVSVARTSADYGLGWSFYWPQSIRSPSRTRARRKS